MLYITKIIITVASCREIVYECNAINGKIYDVIIGIYSIIIILSQFLFCRHPSPMNVVSLSFPAEGTGSKHQRSRYI